MLCSISIQIPSRPATTFSQPQNKMSSKPVALLLGDKFPDFEAETTKGKIKLHEYLGSSWGLLCYHPADYTQVCTTELGTCAKLNGHDRGENGRARASCGVSASVCVFAGVGKYEITC